MTLYWILTSTHKYHMISIQYPSYKCLPEKLCLDCLWILIMPWLFKDPAVIMKKKQVLTKDPIVTVAWLNSNYAQSNFKKWPKKIQLPQMDFFLKKQLIKFSFTYQPLSSCKIKNKSYSGSSVMRMHHFWTQNGPFAPK